MESEGPKAFASAQGREEEKCNAPKGGEGAPKGPELSVDERERLEEQYREAWLEPDLAARLESIRKGVTKLFEEYKNQPQLPGFTPHGVQHCKGVEALLYRLIPGERYKRLSKYERYLLLASAWLHDLGMISGLLSGDGFASSLEDVRARHPERSEEFIVNNPARCGIQDEIDAPVMGLLARLHGGGIESALEYQNVGGHDVRIQLIAAYLCLADALHIDASRAPSDAYAICLAYDVPVASKIHWIKSRFVSGIQLYPKQTRIVLQFKRPNPTQEAELRSQGVDIEGIRRIHDLVVREVRKNLAGIQKYIRKGEVAQYEEVESEEAPMLLDRQVLRDLRMVVNNPDFMANPSSSRLADLMLRTVADILEIDEWGVPRPVSLKEQLTQRKKVRVFFNRLEEEVLRQRPCHLSLTGLLSELREYLDDSEAHISSLEGDAFRRPNLAEWGGKGAHPYQYPGGSVISRKLVRLEHPKGELLGETSQKDPLILFVNKKLESQKRRRRRVRMAGQRYLADFFKRQTDDGKNPCPAWKRRPLTVLLFGYSELVIKALCGFRDHILKKLMEEYLDREGEWGSRGQETPRKTDWVAFQEPGDMDFGRPFHLQNLERMASDHFRLFVCSGEPKNASETTEELGFQEGFHYAEALARHGFTNIVRVPDMVGAGNLLHRAWDEGDPMEMQFPPEGGSREKELKDPMVDFVLMGVNGVGIVNGCEERGDNPRVRFKHGAGHLAMAAAVAGLTETYGNASSRFKFRRLPRMVFVASCDKFKLQDSVALGQKRQNAIPEWVPKGSESIWSWLPSDVQTAYGYWVQKGFYGEAVRDKPFPLPHRGQVEGFRKAGVRLYNPREEVVWPGLVDDLIWDDGFFLGTEPAAPEERAPLSLRNGKVSPLFHKDVSALGIHRLAGMKNLVEVARWVSILHKKVRPCCIDLVPVRASKSPASPVVEQLRKNADVEILGDPIRVPRRQDGQQPDAWLYHVKCWSGQRGYVRAEDLGLWGTVELSPTQRFKCPLHREPEGDLLRLTRTGAGACLEYEASFTLVLLVRHCMETVEGPKIWHLVGTPDDEGKVQMRGWIPEAGSRPMGDKEPHPETGADFVECWRPWPREAPGAGSAPGGPRRDSPESGGAPEGE